MLIDNGFLLFSTFFLCKKYYVSPVPGMYVTVGVVSAAGAAGACVFRRLGMSLAGAGAGVAGCSALCALSAGGGGAVRAGAGVKV